MIDVLVDMTALNTGSRERGIGRYVRSLCLALAARESWLPKYPGLLGGGLSIAGLVRHWGKSEGRPRSHAAVRRRLQHQDLQPALPAPQAGTALVLGRPVAAHEQQARAFTRSPRHAARPPPTTHRHLPRSHPTRAGQGLPVSAAGLTLAAARARPRALQKRYPRACHQRSHASRLDRAAGHLARAHRRGSPRRGPAAFQPAPPRPRSFPSSARRCTFLRRICFISARATCARTCRCCCAPTPRAASPAT